MYLGMIIERRRGVWGEESRAFEGMKQ